MNAVFASPRLLRIVNLWGRTDLYLLILVTVLALGMRLPYWQTVPAAGDEVGQAIYAYKITQGYGLPLVGNDAYAGPFFFYLLALLFRLGVADPLVGRTVVLVAGTLTVPVTYAWVRRLRGNRVASLAAALLVAANPHLILLNGHVGGTTFLLPFFTTLFLWFLSRAVDADSYGWLIASAAAAGLALQSNPVAGLLVAGGLGWFAIRTRRAPRLGRYWPLWFFIGGLCVALFYSPVIVYNVTAGMDSVSTMGERSYLWQADPTIHTFFSNAWRLALQLARQISGVLAGEETLRTLLGLPLVYVAWMLAGLVFTTRRVSSLPVLVISPFLVVFPYFSSHYGMIDPVRFTSLLTPVFAACMGMFLSALLERIGGVQKRWVTVAGAAFALALAICPLVPLSQHYIRVKENHLDGRALLDLARQMVEVNQGEPIYVGDTDRMRAIRGILYIPHAYALFCDVHQEFLPLERILGRLYEFSGPAFLLIDDKGADRIQQVTSFAPWPGAANEEARRRGYGLYVFEANVPLVKPDFVLTDDKARDVAPGVPVGVVLGGGVELVGYDVLGSVVPGAALDMMVYWRAISPLPDGTYVGFVHLVDPAMNLVAQDDHVLGQERYPFGAWQLDEVVVDRYVLSTPEGAALGEYALRVGIYTWPDLTRLEVAGHPDDVVDLGFIDVRQEGE